MELTTEICRKMLLHVADGIIENTDFLTEADKMGDSDHGTGMSIGFGKVKVKLGERGFPNLGELFKTCGMAVMMSSGGASGVIFGTLFKDGARALQEKDILDSEGFADFLKLGLEGIMKRGGAKPLDKTMIDALAPALESAEKNRSKPVSDAISQAYKAAKAGSDATKDMVAKFGRMKTLGERTLGHPDPGSITMYLILQYMYDFIKNN